MHHPFTFVVLYYAYMYNIFYTDIIFWYCYLMHTLMFFWISTTNLTTGPVYFFICTIYSLVLCLILLGQISRAIITKGGKAVRDEIKQLSATGTSG